MIVPMFLQHIPAASVLLTEVADSIARDVDTVLGAIWKRASFYMKRRLHTGKHRLAVTA